MNQITTTNNTGLSELNSKGIVTINTILVPKSIDDEIHNNELLANVFAKVIENNNYFSEIPVKKDKTGKIKEIKKWVNISGWSFIDRVLKITPHIVKSELKFVKREKARERLEYCCTCELRTVEGLVFSTALGKANSGEEYKEKFTESKLESLAQSRSISKAHRIYFQDILEKLNLNNDFIIEADFVEKSLENKDPQNTSELISKHSELMKKHSLQSNEQINENTAKLENELNEGHKKQLEKEKRKGTVITGSFTKKEEDKTTVEKAIENSEKRAKENQEPELTVLYIPEDFEEISDEKLVETIIERTKCHLNAESGEAEINDVRKLFILHKEELNNLREGRSNLADECVKTLAGAK